MTDKSPYKPFGTLRFTLALLVLVQHFSDSIAPGAVRQTVFPWGAGNVALLGFFIISGFIICEAYYYNYRERPGAYMKNRLLRIVPAYWGALAVSIIAHFFILRHYGMLKSPSLPSIQYTHFKAHNIIRNVLAVFSPFHMVPTHKEYAFIPYAWALQTEMMFYVTVFLTGYSYHRWLKARVGFSQEFWLGLAACAGIATASLSQMGYLPKALEFGSYFAFGGSLFFFLNGERRALVILLPALAQMLWHFQTYGAADFSTTAPNRPGQLLLLAIIVTSIIALAALRVRHTQFDKRLGELSYSLYLNHYVVVIVILNTAEVFSAGGLATGLLAALLLAQAMFLAIEKPLIRLRKTIRENL